MSSEPNANIVPATAENIARAAAILQSGGLVAFPTETVYGLGANALDSQAVAKIYAAKERPSFNPLIVHLHHATEVHRVVQIWPETAQQLADAFWPGPLTFVLPKNANVPDIVTANLATVGVRVPAHPVALQLLKLANVPVAAPSANRFMQLSPTRAQHVWNALGPRLDLLLDGGSSAVGIESTVLDLSHKTPILLRPGAISQAQIESVIGPIELFNAKLSEHSARPSPGLISRHYAPQTRALRFEQREHICKYLQMHAQTKIGLLSFSTSSASTCSHEKHAVIEIVLPNDATIYARELYNSLHELDAANCAIILVEMPPELDIWRGVRDRIVRATNSNE